jgi:hypothetical protein
LLKTFSSQPEPKHQSCKKGKQPYHHQIERWGGHQLSTYVFLGSIEVCPEIEHMPGLRIMKHRAGFSDDALPGSFQMTVHQIGIGQDIPDSFIF